MTRLTYNLDHLHELRNAIARARAAHSYNLDMGGGYLTISCRDDQGREASITTNSHGEGLFYWNERDCCYSQSTGTCQYSIAAWSDQKARRELRQAWERRYVEEME